MPCRYIQTHLDDFIDNRLSPKDKELWTSHFEVCTACQLALNQEKEIILLLKSAPAAQHDEIYWQQLEGSILSRTIGAEESISEATIPENVNFSNILQRYLIPLAAAIVLLLGSFALSNFDIHPALPISHTSLYATSDDVLEHAAGDIDSGVFAAILTASPGSPGRYLIFAGNSGGTR